MSGASTEFDSARRRKRRAAANLAASLRMACGTRMGGRLAAGLSADSALWLHSHAAAGLHGEPADARRSLVLGPASTTCCTPHMNMRILTCSCRGTKSLGAGDRPVAIAVPKPAMRGQSGHVTVRSEDRSIDRHRRPPEQPATCAAGPQTQCGQGLVFCAGSGRRIGAQGPELGGGVCWRWAIWAWAGMLEPLQR